jgi:uncharacterized membrane protein YphA (DoxX/SURF4 family)
MDILQHPPEMGHLFIRCITGILFMLQGYDKIFRMGIGKVAEAMEPAYRLKGITPGMVKIIALLSSWIEFTGGILILTGLFFYPALYLLSLDLVIVVFGMALLEPAWDMRIVFPRMVLVTSLLIWPGQSHCLMADQWFNTALPVCK